MTNEAFVIYILDSPWSFFGALLISIFFFIILYRKTISSMFDPLALHVLSSMFGLSVVLFLFFESLISSYYFTSYLFTQFAFFGGFFLFRQDTLIGSKAPSIKIKNDLLLTESCFIVFASLSVVLQFFAYVLVGIPLFKESRLDAFAAGGGIGLISRFLSVLFLGGLFTAIVTYHKTKKRWLKNSVIFYSLLATLFFILSGSRSSFISFFFILFVYKAMENKKTVGEKKKNVLLILVIGVVVVLIMSIKTEDIATASSEFLIRIVGSGDAYWAAYPNDNIEQITPANPILAIFGDIFATYRIVSWENIPKAVGLQLFNMNYPYWDVNFGSNARHNVLGYVYFGYFGSIVFSFFLGLFLGFFRSYGFKKMRNTGVLGMLFCILYFKVASVETDLPYVIAELNSVFLTFLLAIPFVVLVYLTQKRYEQKY
jgi:oligosaccharide repeat unit polymerase